MCLADITTETDLQNSYEQFSTSPRPEKSSPKGIFIITQLIRIIMIKYPETFLRFHVNHGELFHNLEPFTEITNYPDFV